MDRLGAFELDISGDFSSAAPFVVAATLLAGSELRVHGVNVNPTRIGLLSVLERMGANIAVFNRRRVGGEPVGDLDIRSAELVGTTIQEREVPLLIDELPLFALLATYARGDSIVSGASELRAKETDRIEAVVDGLRPLGAHIRATSDGFVVRGVPTRLRGGSIDARGDHRIAMLGGVAGLVSREGVEVRGADSIAVSFPGFFDLLDSLRGADYLMIVAIDGPAGAGKSTVARQLAERLGFRYLDTGAMYRALTWLARRRQLALDLADELAELAVENPVEFDEAGRVFIGGSDVTASIRRPDIDKLVPVVARHHQVREVMRERQRALGGIGNVVIEGRDIGTVVAPQAQVKVYLFADAGVRAARRSSERPGVGADALATDLRMRDEKDAVNMRPAEDAVQIDTTDLEVDQVVALIEELVVARRP